jgi:hypothetical protein
MSEWLAGAGGIEPPNSRKALAQRGYAGSFGGNDLSRIVERRPKLGCYPGVLP